MDKYVINGFFLTQRITGLQRMGYETLICLDEIASDMDIELLVPDNCEADIPPLESIKVIRLGDAKDRWNTKVAGSYAKKSERRLVNIVFQYSTVPHSIVTIGDLRVLEKIDGVYTDKIGFRVKNVIQALIGIACSDKIVTISEFSKERIMHFLHVKEKKITVIPCGWQHYTRIEADYGVFDKFPDLRGREFYFSLGSAAPHKNHKWVAEVAKNNPNSLFVVTGGKNVSAWGEQKIEGQPDNILFTGYLSDGEVKALMSECKAFLFPSLYEGFGIPPLEAMSVGTRCIVSDIPVFREVFGDSVHYIDPHDYNVKLDGILDTELKADPNDILSKYSWEKAAKSWKEIMSQ